jgi:hypothetical protein
MRPHSIPICLIFVALLHSIIRAADVEATSPQPVKETAESIRVITDADSIFAIYVQSYGLSTDGRAPDRLIFAAWPDGRVIWSENLTQGGKPYRTAIIHPATLDKVFATIKRNGYFNDTSLEQTRFGPDSSTTVVYLRAKRDQLRMQSWHELYEAGGKVVATEAGLVPLAGRSRPEVLRGASAEFLYYRLAWSELRLAAAALVPAESQVVAGNFEIRKGKATWIEQ